MDKRKLIGLIVLCANINISFAQTVDLTSVDEFFNVTSILKEGNEVSEEQWKNFDNSNGYKDLRQASMDIIKSSVVIAFGSNSVVEQDSILSITQEEMNKNETTLLKKLTLVNYLDINDNYELIKAFRENYDFDILVEKAKLRLSSFFDKTIDSTTVLKPIYFFFINADGGVRANGIYIDLNLIFKITEEQRINFLAHEFFHNYREKYVNYDYYKNDLFYIIDSIQDEGIADLIDKSEGYEKYFNDIGEIPEMVESWVRLYSQAQEDLERLQNLTLKFSRDEISKSDLGDEVLEIVRYKGHPIGFFMANNIVNMGYKSEMLKSFYNPYEFYRLYNKAAEKQNLFQLNNEFMDYLKSITEKYYR